MFGKNAKMDQGEGLESDDECDEHETDDNGDEGDSLSDEDESLKEKNNIDALNRGNNNAVNNDNSDSKNIEYNNYEDESCASIKTQKKLPMYDRVSTPKVWMEGMLFEDVNQFKDAVKKYLYLKELIFILREMKKIE